MNCPKVLKTLEEELISYVKVNVYKHCLTYIKQNVHFKFNVY